jgi:nucleotide-binding universal stress UspA family protein
MAQPDRILLATDLTARSDRALDRALMLVRRGAVELTVLHVIEPVPGGHPRMPDVPALAALVRGQLRHDLAECAERTHIRIEEGDTADVIVRVAREQACTTVVVGVARSNRLGRTVLGKTVERLVRGLDAPLLIVSDRPRSPYERVAVAVDFSPVSVHAMRAAAALCPGQRLAAFHAYQPLAAYMAADRERHAEHWKEVAEASLAAWLASSNLEAETRARIVARVEHGEPAHTIRDAASRGEHDLVVIGSHGRGRVFEFFVGSVAKRILAELPCDALFVREARP